MIHFEGRHFAGWALSALILGVSSPLFPARPQNQTNPPLGAPSSPAVILPSDFKALLEKAEAGDADAQEKVGAAYCEGVDVPQNYHLGHDWLEKAARQDNTHAASLLGHLYAAGLGVPVYEPTAFQWFLLAASGGDAADELELGDRYFEGKGVAQSYYQGLDWYTKAARQGNSEAKLQLGLAYLNGLGTFRDPEQAFSYFISAAFHNNARAQYNVASCFWNGIYVKKDPVQAYKWCSISLQKYNGPDVQTLWHTLETSLTPEQKQQGEALILNWPQERQGNAAGPVLATFTSGKSAKMPFEWGEKEIFLTVDVNGHKLKFALDTGAGHSSIDGICVSELNLPRSSTYDQEGGIGKNTFLGNQTDKLRLSLPGLNFDQVSLEISPALQHIDGLLGFDLIRNYVLKIDYVDKTIEFIDPTNFDPTDAGQPIPLTIDHLKVYVGAMIKNSGVASSTANFVLDTGCNSGMVLSQHYLQSNPRLTFADSRTGTAVGYGGSLRQYHVDCSEALIGNQELKDPSVSLVEADQGAFAHVNGLIGNDVWKNFDVTLDFPNSKLYLKPNSQFHAPTSPAPIKPPPQVSSPD